MEKKEWYEQQLLFLKIKYGKLSVMFTEIGALLPLNFKFKKIKLHLIIIEKLNIKQTVLCLVLVYVNNAALNILYHLLRFEIKLNTKSAQNTLHSRVYSK